MFSDKAGSDIWYTWLAFLLRAGPWCQRNLVTAWESRLNLTESYALFNSILKFHYWDGRLEKPSIELGMTSSLTVESLCFPPQPSAHLTDAMLCMCCVPEPGAGAIEIFAHGRWRARYQRNENQGEFPWHSMIQPSRKTEPIFEGSLDVKLPTIWTDEKHRWEQSEKRKAE